MGILGRYERAGNDARAYLVGVVLLTAIVAGTGPCRADGAAASDDFRVTGQPLWQGDNISAGGVFGVEGKSVLPSNGIGSREFSLSPGRPKSTTSTDGCPCQGLFGDGFESGDFSAWSASSGL